MAIDVILGLGDDQFSNLFRLVFPNGIPGGGNGETVALRMDQTIQIPEITTGTYDIYYRGLKLTKPTPFDESDKTLTCDVRIDQQWSVYDALTTWKRLCFDWNSGLKLPSAVAATTMLIQALDGNHAVVKTFRFGYVYLKGFQVASFESESSTPLRVTLNMVYSSLIIE